MPSPFHFGLILAGGSGTRLWPLSRKSQPKHLLSLFDAESLVQKTAKRTLTLVPAERIYTVTHADFYEETKRQLEEIHTGLGAHVIAEPSARNTLPAIALGVLLIGRKNPDAVISVFPSDHLISGPFSEAWQNAFQEASRDKLVTFGISPTSPETGYGYIRAKKTAASGYDVENFIEKPSLEAAQKLIAEGNCYWNSGMFVFKASVFLEEMQRHQPELLKNLEKISSQNLLDPDLYASLPSLSIDYGLMEKSDRISLVPGDFHWNDLGTWKSVHQNAPQDDRHNFFSEGVIAEDCQNSWVFSENGSVGVLGLKDTVVVQSGNRVLVCPLEKSQDVKKISEGFSQMKKSETGTTTLRPWGQFTVLEEGAGYKIKRIVVAPGHKLSLQRHEHRAEHWVVIQGSAKVTNGSSEIILKESESTFIPKGQKHRLENPSETPLVIIEVQTGGYVGEDDIQRFDDIYGRTTKSA